MHVARRAANQKPIGVHQPSRSNRCRRRHATETKQVTDLRRLEGYSIFGRNRFIQYVRQVINIKTTVLTTNHRLLSIDYRLRWPTRKKRMESAIDWSYIALPYTRTDLVTSTTQCQPLPRFHCPNKLPRLIFNRGERLDHTHAFVAETHAMAIIHDIQ